MAKKKNNSKKLNKAPIWFVLIVGLIIAVLYNFPKKDKPEDNKINNEIPADLTISDSDFSVHMPQLGNKFAGDCTLIKSGNTEILIDAGSKSSSIDTLTEYINRYCTDNILEYVIVTHAHEDHYACFAIEDGSIFDVYDCKTVIDFSQVEKGKDSGKMYNAYISELNDEIANGAVHYTASQCIENDNAVFDVTESVTLEILDSYYYHNRSSNENNHSVCCTVTYSTDNDEKTFLFTGDLEDGGEKKLLDLNPELKDVYFYKAGHHGSSTSSCDEFLEVIRPKIVFVGCVAGSSEYSSTNEGQFPTKEFVDRISKYTDQIYVTTLCVDYKAGEIKPYNGDLVICYFKSEKSYSIICSDNNTIFKESQWFKENRAN